MKSSAKIADECLWLKHVESPDMREILASIAPGSTVWLKVDGQTCAFTRTKSGPTGSETAGFRPAEKNNLWNARYQAGTHSPVELSFAGVDRG